MVESLITPPTPLTWYRIRAADAAIDTIRSIDDSLRR